MSSNTGNYNTGDCNTGDCNTGDRNTGYCNTGYYNTGYCNTGYYNTGDCNTGDCNTGNRNTGDCNTGYCNTGNYNTGNYNTGDCNTTNPEYVRLFNKETDWEYFGEKHRNFRRLITTYQTPLCEWVSQSNMSDKEKDANPTYKTTGGYLKVNKERQVDGQIADADRDFFLSVPNFDAEILKECTGIDINCDKVKISIDGKETLISKESAVAMAQTLKQFYVTTNGRRGPTSL